MISFRIIFKKGIDKWILLCYNDVIKVKEETNMYNRTLSNLWERTLDELCLIQNSTKEEINDVFHDFKKDLEQNYGKKYIEILTNEKNNNRTRITIDGNSKCFDFSKATNTSAIECLIQEIERESFGDSDNYRLNAKTKNIKTYGDMLKFLQEELLNKKCGNFDDIRYKIGSLLHKINSDIAVTNDGGLIYVWLSCGKSFYRYYGTNCRYLTYENPLLFIINVKRTIISKKHDRYYSVNHNEYAIKSIEFESDNKEYVTLEETYNEWKRKEEEKNNAESISANNFLVSLRAHGFESLNDLTDFIKTATANQKQSIKSSLY